MVRFDDIVEGKTMREEVDPGSGVRRRVIIEHKGDLHPQIVIEDEKGNPHRPLPAAREGPHRGRERRRRSRAGTLLAKTPREITGTQDITGGLPRVTEVFEARQARRTRRS